MREKKKDRDSLLLWGRTSWFCEGRNRRLKKGIVLKEEDALKRKRNKGERERERVVCKERERERERDRGRIDVWRVRTERDRERGLT